MVQVKTTGTTAPLPPDAMAVLEKMMRLKAQKKVQQDTPKSA